MATPILTITGVLAAALLLGVIFDRVRRGTRTKIIRAVGFPVSWVADLPRGLAVYQRLGFDLREKLQEVAFFKINDLVFDGLGEYERVSDEIKVSIGAHIGLLHAHLRIPPLPSIRTVVVGSGETIEPVLSTSPETWPESTLVTIWDPRERAARMAREERNPELMAHVKGLAPSHDGRLFFAGWARSLHSDSPRARVRAAEMAPELADDPTLFAAATEIFIVDPEQLAKVRPDFYRALRAFYRLDPCRWHKS